MNEAPHGLIEEFVALARAQAAALDDGALERFDELLDRRDALLARLGARDAGAGTAAPGEQAEALLAEVLDLDRRNQAALAALLQEVREQLPALAAGRRATTAYRLDQRQPPAFIDRAS